MKRIFIDAEKCDGCMSCTLACMNAHRKDAEGESIYTLDLTDPENQSRNFIKKNPKGGYIPLFCRHCGDPDCANACMSGALKKDLATGLVKYDKEKCAGCYMCVMNCRYGIPQPDASLHYMVKCDFCEGKDGPSCVKACPKEAIYVKEV